MKNVCLATLALLISHPLAAATPGPHPSERFGTLLHQDDFREGLGQWHVESERPGRIVAQMGVLEIDVPGGATLWFKPRLQGPVAIEFEATAVKAGGRNDRGSDLICFWMASEGDAETPVFARRRTGRSSEYDVLRAYYVNLGADHNTRARFLRYAGNATPKPLAAEHELGNADALLPANRSQTITLIASGRQIEYWRNSQRLFEYADPEPYRQGWFAIRTVQSHLKIARLRIHALEPAR
ncbi:MAG TPA: DUF6250 domain-containing protein [Povalibacter sp.]|uniref:DUF6250 domain-containing protein n=1 Tax=Povalibacter sp. TaxID=1962978 RepID=UPI002C0E6558|nr:DUF6250 domain-containing protein [Povalibacter sp.]HMN43522.1 DUF6250 domain-containing protein [Povalibacter sp.]